MRQRARANKVICPPRSRPPAVIGLEHVGLEEIETVLRSIESSTQPLFFHARSCGSMIDHSVIRKVSQRLREAEHERPLVTRFPSWISLELSDRFLTKRFEGYLPVEIVMHISGYLERPKHIQSLLLALAQPRKYGVPGGGSVDTRRGYFEFCTRQTGDSRCGFIDTGFVQTIMLGYLATQADRIYVARICTRMTSRTVGTTTHTIRTSY